MKRKSIKLLSIALIGTMLSGCGSSSGGSTSSSEENGLNLPNAEENAIVEINNTPTLLSKDFELSFSKNKDSKYILQVAKTNSHERVFYQNTPAQIKVRGEGSGIGIETFIEKTYKSAYDSIIQKKYGYLLKSKITTNAGSVFSIEDSYYINSKNVFALYRNVSVIEANSKDVGFASMFQLADESNSSSYEEFNYFIPSILYKDTSNVVSGAIASNLDLDKVLVKETRTGLPMVMSMNKETNNTIGLMHLNPEISVGDIVGGGTAGEVNNDLQYGSIGLSIMPNVSVDFTYPCTEGPNTYDSGQGQVRRYHSVAINNSHHYSLGIIPSHCDNYNDAMTYTYKKAFDAEQRKIYDMSIDDVYQQNIDIFSSEYREYKFNNSVVCAGFPWSLELPNGTNNQGVSLQMGFVGQQIPAAYQLLRYGFDHNDETIKKHANNILDFWSSSVINSTFFPTVWWDPSNSQSGGTRREYPSFLRCMVDGLEGMLDAYRIAKAYGVDNQKWYDMVYKYGTNLVSKQNEDGSFYRAYKVNGSVETDTSNANTQGTSKLNTPIAIRFLAKMYELTKEEKFKTAALKAAEFSYTTLYQNLGKYVGGTPDNPNTVDKEAAVYAMYGFNAAYSLSKEEKFLKAAEHAAISSLSWTYVYDFAVPSGSTENALKNPFAEGGVIGFSIIATGHSGADNFSAYTYYETYKLYVETGDEFFKNAALLLQNDTKLSTDYDGRMGFKYRAMMPEATNVSDFSFKSVGTWLPWSGVANLEPITNMVETFGNNDISKINNSIEELQSRLNTYGVGGNPLSR